MIADGRDFGDHVADHASSPVITAAPAMEVEEAAELMVRHGVRRLVVVEGDRLTGIVTLDDLVVAHRRRGAGRPALRARHPGGRARLLLPRARRRLSAGGPAVRAAYPNGRSRTGGYPRL